MTTKARVVVQDAKYAIEAHTGTLQAEHFRISWIALVTLLRAVGHVLKKVDCSESAARKAAIEQKWKELSITKPEPAIFWGFIELERNRFLKNYEHGIRREVTVLGPAFKGTETTISIDVGNRGGGGGGLVSGLQSTISSGPFAGQSERAIAWQAYDWWVSYLDEIDAITAGNDA